MKCNGGKLYRNINQSVLTLRLLGNLLKFSLFNSKEMITNKFLLWEEKQ